MSVTGDSNFDHVLCILLLIGALYYVHISRRQNANLLAIIGGSCLIICIASFIATLQGVEVDTRRLVVTLCLSSFFIYHVAPFLYVAGGSFDRFSKYVFWSSLKYPVVQAKVHRSINRLIRGRKGGKRAELAEKIALKRPRAIYILTTEVGSALNTESGKSLANSWLFKGSTKFHHWTIMVDNICYELGRLQTSKDGFYEYGVRRQPFEAWKARRSIRALGFTLMMGKYSAGHTSYDDAAILAAAQTIWKVEFKGMYDINRQNCQDFADRLRKRIQRQDTEYYAEIPKKLSSTYWKATRPVRIPWYVTRYGLSLATWPAYYSYVVIASRSQSFYSRISNSSTISVGTDRSSDLSATTIYSAEESTQCLLEEEVVVEKEGTYF